MSKSILNEKVDNSDGLNSSQYGPSTRRHYVPDLSAFMSLCDANYAKMMQLLPEFEHQNTRSFGLSRSKHVLGEIHIQITERCKYTTTLNIKQNTQSNIDNHYLQPTQMEVRIYHDAKMAEVLSYQGRQGLKASYTYPNSAMLQKDEKALCNEFLADWLSYCLKFGHHHESPFQQTL